MSHQEDQGQPESTAQTVGNVVSEAEYRYDPEQDSDWYPPVACTLSEFALLSVGVNPHNYIVSLAFIEAEDRMRSAVFRREVLDGVISERDRLTMDGVERLAAVRHEKLRDAVFQGIIPMAEAYKNVPERFQKFSFNVLKSFAGKMRWGFWEEQVSETSTAQQLSPASLLIEQLTARTGWDSMPRLLVVLEAYRRIYEEHKISEGATLEEKVQLVKDLWQERAGKPLDDTPAHCLTYVLHTTLASKPGRRPRRRS